MTAEEPAEVEVMGVELVVPDPRSELVPPGWCAAIAAPAIEAMTSWEELDDAEARIQAFVGYYEALGDDVLELEKALRVVEKRRGDLLGPPQPGRRTDLEAPLPQAEGVPAGPPPDEPSPATMSRWRTLARNWDDLLWPHVLAATNRHEVTQTRLLKLVDAPRAPEPPPPALGSSPSAPEPPSSPAVPETEAARHLRLAARAYFDQGGDAEGFLRMAAQSWRRIAQARASA